MKTQAIIFSSHEAPTLSHLIKEAKDRGQAITTKRNFLGFNPSEGAGYDFVAQTKRNAYGVKVTDKVIPPSLNEILSQIDMGEDADDQGTEIPDDLFGKDA